MRGIDVPSEEVHARKMSLILKVKIVQFLFFSVFAFGLSWFISDLISFLKLPISSASVGTMIFGITGMIGCEIVIRWISKFFPYEQGKSA